MPITREEFEDASAEELRAEESSGDGEVFELLAENPGEAYTLNEIQSSVRLPLIELAARLTRLRQDGAVRHKGSYWAVARERAQRVDERRDLK
jgi:hypothetical protein